MKLSPTRLALASIALSAMTPAANAAQSISLSPAAPDGSISGSFQNVAIPGGSFSNIFNFTLPSAGDLNATISSIFRQAQNNNVDFTGVTLNGQALTIGSTGNVEFRFLNGLGVNSGPQTLAVNGSSGGNGSYAGTLSFAPQLAGVPEPAAWATLIFGFALVGTSMRRNRPSKLQKVSA